MFNWFSTKKSNTPIPDPREAFHVVEEVRGDVEWEEVEATSHFLYLLKENGYGVRTYSFYVSEYVNGIQAQHCQLWTDIVAPWLEHSPKAIQTPPPPNKVSAITLSTGKKS